MAELLKKSPQMVAAMQMAGSPNINEATKGQEMLAKALEIPLRQGVLSGDVLENIYQAQDATDGKAFEWPLDLISPGSERDFTAYVIPNHGKIPQRHVEGDYVTIPTYDIGNAIDTNLKYIAQANWDVLARMAEVLEAGFVKKMNDDGWHTLLAAGLDRNILVFDGDALQGQFTKRLVSLGKTLMQRNGGGNSSSVNRGMLTDLYLSPEGLEDIRNWNVDQIDEITRRDIFTAENTMSRIFGVNLHSLDELGVGQEYQLFYTSDLGGSINASDDELVVGLDLRKRDSFIMPVREEVSVFADTNLHREKRFGYYGWASNGFGVLDNRRVILLSF